MLKTGKADAVFPLAVTFQKHFYDHQNAAQFPSLPALKKTCHEMEFTINSVGIPCYFGVVGVVGW